MNVGEKLRQLRKRAGLTQVQLADASGVSQPTISEVESGKHGLGVDPARKLAKALNIEWACFFDDNSRQVDNAS